MSRDVRSRLASGLRHPLTSWHSLVLAHNTRRCMLTAPIDKRSGHSVIFSLLLIRPVVIACQEPLHMRPPARELVAESPGAQVQGFLRFWARGRGNDPHPCVPARSGMAGKGFGVMLSPPRRRFKDGGRTASRGAFDSTTVNAPMLRLREAKHAKSPSGRVGFASPLHCSPRSNLKMKDTKYQQGMRFNWIPLYWKWDRAREVTVEHVYPRNRARMSNGVICDELGYAMIYGSGREVGRVEAVKE